MRRLVPVIAAASLAGLAGYLAGSYPRRPKIDVGLYASVRLAAVQQHLDEAEPGYVLVTGDSNAELMSPAERLCGSPIVDAGVSGATTAVYLAAFEKLRFPVRPRAALVILGTNDINARNGPRGAAAAARFERHLMAMVVRLRNLTDTVLVTALPPLGRDIGERFDAAAALDYSARIAVVCPKLGCRIVDAFSGMRDGTSGFGLPGVNRDGVHLARYRPVLANVAAALCPNRAASGPLPPAPDPPSTGAAAAP